MAENSKKKVTMARPMKRTKAAQPPKHQPSSALTKIQEFRLKQALMTDDNLARPVHILVQDFQQEAVLTLVELMRFSKNDATRQKSATEILALGGNSAEILKIQAIQSGRNKDISQMTNDELDAFISDAKRKLDLQRDIASHDAIVVNPEQSVVNAGVEKDSGGGVVDPIPGDMLKPHDSEEWGL